MNVVCVLWNVEYNEDHPATFLGNWKDWMEVHLQNWKLNVNFMKLLKLNKVKRSYRLDLIAIVKPTITSSHLCQSQSLLTNHYSSLFHLFKTLTIETFSLSLFPRSKLKSLSKITYLKRSMENGYVAYLYLNFKKKNTLKEILFP